MIVEITDIEFVSCIAKDYGVHSVEEGEDLFFTATVANNGNIRLNPKMHIDIWDQEQQEILASYDYDDTQVAPTTQEALEIAVPTTGLELGQYWAEISSLDCFSQSVLTFDVLEEGSLRAEGVLQEMRGKTWVDAGETVQIDAVFRLSLIHI